MSKLNLGQGLQSIREPATRNMLQQIEDAINNLGSHLAADPVGLAATPPPLQGVNVKTAGELVHVTLTHNVPINKNINYFVEHDTDPSFPAPHVVHLGTSRGTVLNLPTKTDGGVAVSYYFRAYAQSPGSHAARPVNYGGANPTAVTLGGTTQLTLQPSTGSGTAAGNGQQGGYGFGRVLQRPPVGPKRNIPV